MTTKPDDEIRTKLAAALEAVERAASDLLAHAEGLGMLAVIERNRVEWPDPSKASRTPSLYPPGSGGWDLIYSHAAQDTRWKTVKAAIAFAGAREAELQRAPMFHFEQRRVRDALELVTGFEPMPPPPVTTVALRIGDHFPGVTPEAVHLQGWRDCLMTSTAANGRRA